MRKIGILAGLATTVLTALTLTSPVPASAESGSLAYPSHDAPAAIDIQKLRVANNQDRVRLKLEIRNLRARGRFTLYWVSEDYQTGFQVRIKRSDEGLRVRFAYRPKIGGWHSTACPGADVSWAARRDQIKARVPQDCYPWSIPSRWWFGAHAQIPGAEDSPSLTLELRRG